MAPLDSESWDVNKTGTPRDALAPYPWSGSVNWCLPEGLGSGDERCPVGLLFGNDFACAYGTFLNVFYRHYRHVVYFAAIS